MGLAGSPWALAALILPAGALCAPVITATAEEVARRVPERVRGEAMGWHGSALTIGNAIGAPLAGASIDAVAPWAGFAVVGATGLLLAVLGLVALRVFGGRPVPGRDADPAAPVAGVGEVLDGETATAEASLIMQSR